MSSHKYSAQRDRNKEWDQVTSSLRQNDNMLSIKKASVQTSKIGYHGHQPSQYSNQGSYNNRQRFASTNTSYIN